MKPPSEPQINKSDPKKWFIYWNHDVPYELWGNYRRKRERIVRIGNINELEGPEREKNAEFWRQVWQYNLDVNKYNPFEEELNLFRQITFDTTQVTQKIEEVKEVVKSDDKANFPVNKAFNKYILSRKARKLSKATISAYQGNIDWLNEGLTYTGNGNIAIGQLRYTHVSEALDYIAEEREWNATTINKEVGYLMTLFIWLETEEYVTRNPIKGKFVKLPTNKAKHRWYDRDTARIVVNAVLASEKDKLYRAMQFTYWLMIRSKSELRQLRIGDIDRTLKRVRFSTTLSKNNKEEYRDYPPEFEKVLDEMNLSAYPQEYFVFGQLDGTPSLKMCGHNFFSKQFKVIKDRLGLSADYTIYGWKHTRIIHELMKGTAATLIGYMARHSEFKTTKDYCRDYDITLSFIYEPDDLRFPKAVP